MVDQKCTILLTGATGFLGSHLLEELLACGHKVVVLKRSTSDPWRILHLLSQVESYDIDQQPLGLPFEEHEIDVIMHFATLYRKFDNGQEVEEMIESNVTFPAELIRLAVRRGLKAFFNTGTFFECDCSVLPITENSRIKPFNFYAETKVMLDNVLKTYAGQVVVNTFRIFSPYGEKDNQKLIPMLIKKALTREEILLSEGFQKLDFIYAADIVAAYMKALNRVIVSGADSGYELFNLSGGQPLSVREIVSVIEQVLGCAINKHWGAPSQVDVPIAYADISKAGAVLGWKPSYSIHQGIARTIAYYERGGQ